MKSEFSIVAGVDDLRVGEQTFTAEQLEAAVKDALSKLHLNVQWIVVLRPRDRTHPIPGTCSAGGVTVVSEAKSQAEVKL